MASFADLKKTSTVNISDLVKKAEAETSSKKSYTDDRFWKPTRDKSGNGYAVIRFLPTADQPTPWVKYFDHFFKGPTGRWYVEKSLTTIGQADPLAEINTELWNRETSSKAEEEANHEIVRSRKRKLHYVANVLVISDPANPENDGKVFLYDFGAKIFQKAINAMQPEFPDQKPFNPFDLWGGANFSIRIRKVSGYPNYDESSFAAPEELFGGDEDKLKATYEVTHEIGEFIDPKNFKSYDELKLKLDQVLGTAKTADAVIEPAASATSAPSQDSRPTFTSAETATEVPESSGDLDEDMAFFDKAIDDED